jgi:hypothetical protein
MTVPISEKLSGSLGESTQDGGYLPRLLPATGSELDPISRSPRPPSADRAGAAAKANIAKKKNSARGSAAAR